MRTEQHADEVSDDEPVAEQHDARITGPQIVLSLLALVAVAVAQPLLDLIGRNPAFLTAHQMGRIDTIALGVGLPVVVPLVVGLVLVLIGLVHKPTRNVLAAVAVAVLVGVLALVVFRLSGLARALPAPAALLLAAGIGAVVTLLWTRKPGLRRVMSVAAIAAPLTAVMFLTMSPARGVVFPPKSTTAVGGLGADSPNIVLIVVDEFPLVSVLGPDRQIDAENYPALAKLAQDGTWFRNATAMHGFTPDAVPAILTGKYSDFESLPIAEDHPVNLFSLLGGAYDLRAVEIVTELCTAATCESGVGSATDYRATVRDLGVVGAHLVLPPAMTKSLPSLDQGFNDFRAAAEAAGKHDAFIERFDGEKDKNIPADFGRFVRRIEPSERPTLYFNHVLMPHRPWRFTPSGQIYAGVEPPAGSEKKWWKNAWYAAQGYERHLLQVKLIDNMLGDLIRRLEKTGMYDDAIVAVVADHGVSFLPNGPLRRLTDDNFGEIAPVPMLLKAPGQTDGGVSDRPVETVDLMPSILDILGAEPPKDLDGWSVVDDSTPVREEKHFFPQGKERLFGVSGKEIDPFIERKLRIFGARSGSVNPYRVAPRGTRRLLGEAVPSGAAQPGMTARLTDAEAYANLDVDAPAIPAMVTGEVRLDTHPSERPVLAVGVNGRIAAVTLADPGRDGVHRFRAMVRTSWLRDGANDIAVLSVDADGGVTPIALQP